MKLSLVILICLFGFSVSCQIEISEGKIYRWTRIFNDEINSSFFQSLSNSNLNQDFLGEIYKAVENKELSLYFDTLSPGNFGQWKIIPELKYHINPNSPESIYTFSNLDYLTVQEKSEVHKKDVNGNPIIYYLQDGSESYEYEFYIRPFENKDILHIDLLEIGTPNRKTKEIVYDYLALGFQLPYSKSPVWFHYKEIQKNIASNTEYPFLQQTEKRDFLGFQFRQEGYTADLSNLKPFTRRVRIGKNKESASLFSEDFFNALASRINSNELSVFFNYRKEPWDYNWERRNFDIQIVDTIPPQKRNINNYSILARKGPIVIDKYGDTLYSMDAFGNSTLMYEPDVFLYFNLAELNEIRIHEKAIRDVNSASVFEPESIVFVLDTKNGKRELFLLDFDELLNSMEAFKDEPWFTYLKMNQYNGFQFFQSR